MGGSRLVFRFEGGGCCSTDLILQEGEPDLGLTLDFLKRIKEKCYPNHKVIKLELAEYKPESALRYFYRDLTDLLEGEANPEIPREESDVAAVSA